MKIDRFMRAAYLPFAALFIPISSNCAGPARIVDAGGKYVLSTDYVFFIDPAGYR